MYNFEKLTAWQKVMDFCELIYKETRRFPKEEMFGLTSLKLRKRLDYLTKDSYAKVSSDLEEIGRLGN